MFFGEEAREKLWNGRRAMGFHVLLQKVSEDEQEALYFLSSFIGEAEVGGLLSIEKATGQTCVVRPIPGDEQGHRSLRASVKLK